jgi:hypothetical protein
MRSFIVHPCLFEHARDQVARITQEIFANIIFEIFSLTLGVVIVNNY